MNFESLFKTQKDLDNKIIKKHSLQKRSLKSNKLLALEVEISELANETRCFKYWSSKLPSSKEIILEEYADCLHFILSIGIEYGFQDTEELNLQKPDTTATDQFLNLYVDVTDFIVCSSKDHYLTLFEDFLNLGLYLDFSDDDIEDAYYKKNAKNLVRQNSGY